MKKISFFILKRSTFVFLFVGLTTVTFAWAQNIKNNPSSKVSVAKDRKPDSEACANSTTTIQEIYGREFDLKKNEIKNIYVTFEPFTEITLAKATHPSNCTPKGCATTLNLIQAGQCPKLLLIYNGVLKFTGPAQKKYLTLELTYKGDAIEGGNIVQFFKFNEKTLTYQEIVKK